MISSLSEAEIARRLRRAYNPDRLQSTNSYADHPYVSRAAPLKSAAVLIPLMRYADEWYLLFTRRTDNLENHSGQVSFPGGQCDPQDGTPEQTALREAGEEIGLRPADVRILGRIDEVLTITGYRVTPVVGVIPWPYSFRVSTVEVERVFTMPLNWLAQPGNHWEFRHPQADYKLIAYRPYDGELLWGATARMTLNFLKTVVADDE
ncbi:MAG: CoA pyrophosphatase [Chloroflexi bacterium]|nr:CoA pyrophosphatase [Chloroflexota bacterium]